MAAGDSKFFIISDVFALLRNDTKLQELVGRKIFPIQAPRDTVGDFITVQRDGLLDSQTSKMGGFALLRYGFYIAAVSEDYDRSLEIADCIYTVLNGQHDTCQIKMEDFAELVVDQKFIQILKFSIQ